MSFCAAETDLCLRPGVFHDELANFRDAFNGFYGTETRFFLAHNANAYGLGTHRQSEWRTGKMVEGWVHFDELGLLQKLGTLPSTDGYGEAIT